MIIEEFFATYLDNANSESRAVCYLGIAIIKQIHGSSTAETAFEMMSKFARGTCVVALSYAEGNQEWLYELHGVEEKTALTDCGLRSEFLPDNNPALIQLINAVATSIDEKNLTINLKSLMAEMFMHIAATECIAARFAEQGRALAKVETKHAQMVDAVAELDKKSQLRTTELQRLGQSMRATAASAEKLQSSMQFEAAQRATKIKSNHVKMIDNVGQLDTAELQSTRLEIEANEAALQSIRLTHAAALESIRLEREADKLLIDYFKMVQQAAQEDYESKLAILETLKLDQALQAIAESAEPPSPWRQVCVETDESPQVTTELNSDPEISSLFEGAILENKLATLEAHRLDQDLQAIAETAEKLPSPRRQVCVEADESPQDTTELNSDSEIASLFERAILLNKKLAPDMTALKQFTFKKLTVGHPLFDTTTALDIARAAYNFALEGNVDQFRTTMQKYTYHSNVLASIVTALISAAVGIVIGAMFAGVPGAVVGALALGTAGFFATKACEKCMSRDSDRVEFTQVPGLIISM